MITLLVHLGCAIDDGEEVAFIAENYELGDVVSVPGGAVVADCFDSSRDVTIATVAAAFDTAGEGSAVLMRYDHGHWVLHASSPLTALGGGETTTIPADWQLVGGFAYCVGVGLDDDWEATPRQGELPAYELVEYSGSCAGDPLSGEEWACVPGGADWAYPITIGLEYEDADADGFASWEDCHDADPEQGSYRVWWPDEDGDGVGTDHGWQNTCVDPGPGWSERSDDCNDADFFAAEPGSPLCPSGGSGGLQVTCCEVSTAWVVGPVCWAFRRRRLSSRVGCQHTHAATRVKPAAKLSQRGG